MQHLFEGNSALVQCLQTLAEITHDRNYTFDTESKIQLEEIFENPEEIKPWLETLEKTSNPILKAIHNNDPSRTLYIYWPLSGKISIETVREYLQQITTEKQNAILVIRQRDGKKFGLTPCANTCLENARGHFSIFELNEIYINITRHKCYQPHRLLSQEEWHTVQKKYMINPDRMPVIFHNDPIAKYYGFPIGSVIEITRNYGGTLLQNKYYRKVVKNVQ